MDEILEIINSVENNALCPNINPTVIYNEGWMTRLLVLQSLKEKTTFDGIDFSKISNWTSEALIASPFVTADKNREGYTHADIAMGDFSVDYKTRGEIQVSANAKIFGIIEAKMGSNLSQGTSNAEDYNQASRNVVCIAHSTPESGCETFFYVVAPEETLKKHEIGAQIKKEKIINQIEKRYAGYEPDDDIQKMKGRIVEKVTACSIECFTYESWIEQISDKKAQGRLWDFYKQAIFWNRI